MRREDAQSNGYIEKKISRAIHFKGIKGKIDNQRNILRERETEKISEIRRVSHLAVQALHLCVLRPQRSEFYSITLSYTERRMCITHI